MAHETFYIKQNDTSPALQVTLKDGDGNVVDFTGATVVFSMSAGGVVKVNEQAATSVDAANGVVKYSWAAGDTDTPGNYLGEFEVTFAGGAIQTYPNSHANRLEVKVEKELG